MSRKTKGWLITATVLVLIGGLIFAGAMMVLQWDFHKLSTTEYETNRHTLPAGYRNITVMTKAADVVLVPAEAGEESAVVCYEKAKVKHTVEVVDDTLVIRAVDARKWYDYIHILDLGVPRITISIPAGEYGTLSVRSSTGDVTVPEAFRFTDMDVAVSTGDVTCRASCLGTGKIKTSTGDIRVEGVSAGGMELSVTTGKVAVDSVACQGDLQLRVSTGDARLNLVTCRNLISTGNTGDLWLQQSVAEETVSVERSTGHVRLEGCDAAQLSIRTDTGDVKGSLLSEKVFITHTDTGRVEVPKTVTGGRCEITTDTGDIWITVDA